ncbi:MAG: hypothetical protein AAFX65_08235 [Cyanobacteria bacterium J06638_7]
MVLTVGVKRALVAATPLLGALAFPLAVPLVMRSLGLPAAVLTAVVLGSLWFMVMLRSAEMPSPH